KIVKSLFEDKQTKTIFGKRREPNHDFCAKTNRSWIGYYSVTHNPGYFAGVCIPGQQPPILWVELYVDQPDVPHSLARLVRELPPSLKGPFEAAKTTHQKDEDFWANRK